MENNLQFQPIGYVKSCFKNKNGTPRQPSISSATKGDLSILKTVFNNPEHSLCGISQFSHVWIIFCFHLNESSGLKAKVKPPRLDGTKVGVFATRSPHRPNAVGLTLAKLENVDNDTIFLSGLDIVSGTPVLDIKPYIPEYDTPRLGLSVIDKPKSSDQPLSELAEAETTNINVSDWLVEASKDQINVLFTERAMQNIKKYQVKEDTSCQWKLDHICADDMVQVITDILKADPRSTYRRQKCGDRLYYFTVDSAHITAWFDDTTVPNTVEVLRIVPCLRLNQYTETKQT
uniref:Nef-associated protein 1-like n=1 Tax=Phallusia mammillata TaxID=59560 RepID=A0A6F9D8B6_9ASCI|nr:nef-associated protein 1-like [Phallusia mammillata]